MRKIALLVLVLPFLIPLPNLEAQEVDILWQAETYTPPFYKGKALWSSQSRISLLAIPSGTGTANPASLIYKWTKNGTVLGNINGVGKNNIIFTDSIISRPQTIKVDVLSSDERRLASASVTVVPILPSLAIYEHNPLYGFMFHKETSGVHELENQEVTFTAFPFFFSVLDRITNEINYEWVSNSGGAPETGNSVTYRVPDGAVGSSEIEVRTSSEDKILQSAGKSFLIQFGDQ